MLNLCVIEIIVPATMYSSARVVIESMHLYPLLQNQQV